MNVRELMVRGSFRTTLRVLMKYGWARQRLLRYVETWLYNETLAYKSGRCPMQVQMDRLYYVSAMLHSMDRILNHGIVSKHVLQSMVEAFLGNVIFNRDSLRAVRELGFDPPAFVTISPTGRCNLRCSNCYAADAALLGRQLDFQTFDRILREKRELWGSHFTVISGGEPFLWKDGGYDLLKLAARHKEDVFTVYTNGTLIDSELARRLADAGNVTPAISVEGFEAETDARRGEGVYRRILQAFENLRKHGVPFGVSATATKHNWELITSEEFANFYFFDQGALYGWIFQYMPIGRGQTLELMVPSEVRVKMSERMWRLVREWKLFIVDFWNSGTASMGCISAARPGGYFHINWDGDIMPCVFTPYAADNIHDLYARGDNLNGVISSPFFTRIRKWQRDYGYDKPSDETGNWLCPCAIRDHFEAFAAIVRQCCARPINAEAKEALEDMSYHDGMVEYGRKMQELTEPTWREHYSESRVFKEDLRLPAGHAVSSAEK